VVGTIFRMRRLRRRTKSIESMRALSNYCLAIQMTLTVYLVPNFFISRQNEDLMWHLVGISAGLAILLTKKLYAPIEEPDEVLV